MNLLTNLTKAFAVAYRFKAPISTAPVSALLWIVGSSFLVSDAAAQDQDLTQELTIIPLYESRAILTGRPIPFKVYDRAGVELQIVSVGDASPCYTYIDPFRDSIFHLFCEQPSSVSFPVSASNGGSVLFGPIDVTSLSILSTDVPDPPEEIEPPILSGRAIFAQDCASCHPGQPISTPQTEASVRSALSRGPMKALGLDRKYNSDPGAIEALVEYINKEL